MLEILCFCLEINECDPNPCLNGGTCFDLIQDYRCNCTWPFNGRNCENITGSEIYLLISNFFDQLFTYHSTMNNQKSL